jgi:hypothetical protein
LLNNKVVDKNKSLFDVLEEFDFIEELKAKRRNNIKIIQL